jgi:hypothetical protein
MLADEPDNVQSGKLSADVHRPSSSKLAVLDFIATELPRWRDRRDRPSAQAETTLTEYLCDHLNQAAYLSSEWDHLQFRTETRDEMSSGRKIDLAVKPRAGSIVIEGRLHTVFDALFPIECKRLPTPKGTDRDEREYVFSQYTSTGGIQRFKAGLHGGEHSVAGMIGFVQEESCDLWAARVAQWITDLVASGQVGWSADDQLSIVRNDKTRGTAVLTSSHARSGFATNIAVRHLWIRISR